MSDLTITFTETDTKGKYLANAPGIAEAGELTTSKVSDTLLIVDHTYLPDTLRGKGIAGALAERVIADARVKGQRLVPLCQFFRGYAVKRKEELSDVIQW
ncbi:MAG: GNAT family N-acetyltransferase [Pseudomonadota bacterium]